MQTATTIRSARRQRGLSMNRLARLVGVTRPCIYLWEKGQTHPRSYHADRLEALLDLTPGSLERAVSANRRPATATEAGRPATADSSDHPGSHNGE